MTASGMHIPKIRARLLVVGVGLGGMGSGDGGGGTTPLWGTTVDVTIGIPAIVEALNVCLRA